MTKLIRLPEVCERTGYCRAWIYRLIKEKQFPEPVKTGPRASAWHESEVEQWIAERPRGLGRPVSKNKAA